MEKTVKDVRIEELENLLWRISCWQNVIELYDDGGLSSLRALIGESNIMLLHTRYARLSYML